MFQIELIDYLLIDPSDVAISFENIACFSLVLAISAFCVYVISTPPNNSLLLPPIAAALELPASPPASYYADVN